jgi:hypothetical protein
MRFVSSIERVRSTSIPSRSVAVEGMIWASPLAASGVGPAITWERPALSRKIIASSVFASTPRSPAARSISSRQLAVRSAEATTPPGLFS